MAKAEFTVAEALGSSGAMTWSGEALTTVCEKRTDCGLPLQEYEGQFVIPHSKASHPFVDYSTYSISTNPDAFDKKFGIGDGLEFLAKIDSKGGAKTHLWSTVNELIESSEMPDSGPFALMYQNKILLNARVATLSMHSDSDNWDDWLYDSYAIGYDTKTIALTLGVHVNTAYKLFEDYKKIDMARQRRANDMVDDMEMIHRQVLRGNHEDKETRTVLKSKFTALAETAAWASVVSKANLTRFNPTHKVETVPHIPSVYINTQVVGGGSE